MQNKIGIVPLDKSKGIPYDLLLQADPSKENIDKYIHHSVVYRADMSCKTVGYYVLCDLGNRTTEIKAIVVKEKYQRLGIGTLMLTDAAEKACANGSTKLMIATGNSSVDQLRLYQKNGFSITEIRKNYFVDNYSEPIIENGIPCTDMIVLTKDL